MNVDIRTVGSDCGVSITKSDIPIKLRDRGQVKVCGHGVMQEGDISVILINWGEWFRKNVIYRCVTTEV